MSLALAAMGARYATRKWMRLNLERLEQQTAVQKERARIAHDMHDDLGARPTEILLLTRIAHQNRNDLVEVGTRVGRIARAAGEVVDNLHAIGWP